MSDTQAVLAETATPQAAPAAIFGDSHAPTVPMQLEPRELKIQFTGSGSEYFRIWIVNLLLIVVTLGLYLPFAKARRLRYLWSNTVVDGQALSFHGNAWKMFRGFVLLLLLSGSYAVASRLSVTAGIFAFTVMCALWPSLWRASLQFRMANTGWRGLRFAFTGDVAGAYKAWLPIYIPLVVMVAAQLLLADAQLRKDFSAPVQVYAVLMGVSLLTLMVLTPWGLARIKRYQHGGYALADQQTRMDLGTGRFYGLGFKTLGVGLLAILAPAFALGVLAAVLFAGNKMALTVAVPVGVLVGYLMGFAVVGPYWTARLQNMVWSHTASQDLRFDSQLKMRSLLGLTVVNFLLMALTLGLYRPFAVIATTRLRLEAVSLSSEADIDRWLAGAAAQYQDAAGDAAGDFFGIDMGL